MIPRYDFKQQAVKHKVTLKGKNVCGTHTNMNGKGTLRAGAMAQQKDPLLLLQRTWIGSLVLTMICNSSSRDSDCFWLPQTPSTHVVHIHTCGQTLVHIKLNTFF